MPISTAGLNAMTAGLAAAATHCSLHSANPGATGASELSGGNPAYARQANAWNAAAGGNSDNSNAPLFDVPAGATVAYVGLWTALTNGTFLGAVAVPQAEVYAGQGSYGVTDIDLAAVVQP